MTRAIDRGFDPAQSRPTVVALVVSIALDVGLCVRCFIAWSFRDGGFPDWVPEAYDDFWEYEDYARRFAVLVVAVVFLSWWHRIAKNGITLAEEPPPYSPGSAVGVWFIPFYNFVGPFLVAQHIERASGGRGDSILASWWAAYIVRTLVWGVAARALAHSDIGRITAVYVVGTACSSLAAWLCVRMMRYFEDLQRKAAMDAEAIAEVFA